MSASEVATFSPALFPLTFEIVLFWPNLFPSLSNLLMAQLASRQPFIVANLMMANLSFLF
jgi:hypothetical protein